MLTYEDLVLSLEHAWIAAGLHEHGFVESFVSASHDRIYRVELFPEHDEPLTAENMPPWVEVSFTWSALHQIRSEQRTVPAEPFDLIWTYTVNVHDMHERSDVDLVRTFQHVFNRIFQQFYPDEAASIEPLVVEVRRTYASEAQKPRLLYIQLSSINITDLSDQWHEQDVRTLPGLIHVEMQFAGAVIRALSDAFHPGGRGGYRSVDTA